MSHADLYRGPLTILLHPPAPSLSLYSMSLQEICGYTVPKGHSVCVSPTANQRLEEAWGSEYAVFQPERYGLLPSLNPPSLSLSLTPLFLLPLHLPRTPIFPSWLFVYLALLRYRLVPICSVETSMKSPSQPTCAALCLMVMSLPLSRVARSVNSLNPTILLLPLAVNNTCITPV